MIEDFAVYHAQQNFYKCVQTAELLLWYADKAQDRDQVVNNQVQSWAPSYWIFRYIGWLMLASLPDKKEPEIKESTTERLHGPSQAAIKAPLSAQVPGLREKLSNVPRKMVHEGRSEAALPEWQGAPPLQYSEQIRQEVISDSQVPYHDDWAIAAYTTYHEILDFRGKNPGKEEWATWNFKIPPYRRDPNWRIIGEQIPVLLSTRPGLSYESTNSPTWCYYRTTQTKFSTKEPLESHTFSSQRQLLTSIIVVNGKGVPFRRSPRVWDQGFFPSPKLSALKLPPFDLEAQRPVKNTYNWSKSKFYAARSRKKSPFLKHKYFTVANAADNGWIVDPNPEDTTTDVFDLEGELLSSLLH